MVVDRYYRKLYYSSAVTKQFRLTVKSQVTIPKDVREALGVKPGGLIAFEHDGDRIVLRKGAEPAFDRRARSLDMRRRIERARRLARPLPREMSTDDYMAMIREPVPIPDGE